MPSGYLYVLVNPSIPGLAKVGKTTREPADRVTELSSATGVASPFVLLYQQPVADCDKAEEWVHDALTSRGWRYAPNREFFSAPSHEIVALVFQAAQVVGNLEPTKYAASPAVSDEAPTSEQISEGERLANLALELIGGGPNTLADRPRGILLLQQAADLERLTKPFDIPPTDERASERKERLMDVCSPLVSDAQPAKAV